MGDVTATVREVDGQLVLDDPEALAVARAVAKHNCRASYDGQLDRARHFVSRARERNLCPGGVVVVLVNVDDRHGRALAEALMPGQDAAWQAVRELGQVPFARGLACRGGIHAALQDFDEAAATKLGGMGHARFACVVVDYGVAEVFEVEHHSACATQWRIDGDAPRPCDCGLDATRGT